MDRTEKMMLNNMSQSQKDTDTSSLSYEDPSF